MEQNSNRLFTSSIGFDKRLYNQDTNGSIAHVQMLGNQGILTDEEAKLIQKGLEKIRSEIKKGLLKDKIINNEDKILFYNFYQKVKNEFQEIEK